MLHNTGPYGPNDTPANMGAPLNMSQISAMNMSHNINNLSKMPQQTPQSAAGSYSIPNFSPYAHAPMNMAPQMNQFPNYHSPPFQNSYIAPNSNILHESGWQNGMLPMNLNIQNDQAEAMGSYTNFDKRPSINDYKDMSQYRKAPINIPQVPTKAYHKHSGFNNDYNSFMYNDNSRQHVDYNIDLSVKTQERLEMDNTRRKSLENTVKLIENILINTTKNREMKLNQKSNDNMEKQDESTVNVNITKTNISENDTQGSEEQEDVDDEGNMSATEMEQEESSESEDDVKPSINVGETVNITRIEIEPDVTVKVEQLSSWVDLDNIQPYHRDVNGVSKEDVTGNSIIESEISVAEATEMIKNGSNTEAYLECPHCELVFKHCKRFLIHVKWHSFGLTNEKRMEMAREKEERKHMRKEARVIERMNAKEVTDPSSVGKVFPCKDCDKIFSVKSSLKNHRQRYHATRARECKICRKTVLGWMAHRAHLATHTGVSGYQCSECPKKFKYPHSLAKHRDTHLEKTHACQECPKKFGSQALLKMHMKCHERVLRGATFRCTYCGKGFFESYNLQVHERTHRNERPFHCDICNTSFGTNSSLKRHIKVSHSTSKPHACPTCHRSFVSALILERHERRAHGDPEDFKFVCSQCPCRYLKLKDLQKHVYKVHPKGKRKKKDKSDTE
ncbi:zinc finger protein 583-like [Galleria mellonella]|uniref:Zinc finger protein 583-like n=1 Tax=Galleria mellonella TaxID=7137 RepID=A0A6J1WA40_GALME|nr:zinc finger protein 583-like [Galleria mellonella]